MITILGLFVILGHAPKEQQPSTKKIEGTDFIPSQMYMGTDGLGGLAVNERTQQICLFSSPTSSPQLFPIADLIGSFLVKNGEILGEGVRRCPEQVVTFRNERDSQKESLIKSHHIGCSNEGIQRIDLFVLVYDLDEPLFMVNFLDMETKEGGILFEKSLSTAKHWHYVLDGLILEADKNARSQAETPQENEMAGATP